MNTKKPKATEMPLPLYNSIFGEGGQQGAGTPIKLLIDDLHPFPKQPFRLYTEDKMREMVESVTEFGIISPIIVRPNPNGEGYEIISGHNRVEACRRAGICQIPSFIRDVDDDTAVILMVDSNLRQRAKLMPTEKAKAYEMKMEAMRRRMGRPLKKSGQVGQTFYADDQTGKTTRDDVSKESDDSARQIQRYIRLNRLIPSLQGAVDDGKLAFETAPSLSQAQKLKKMASDGTIDDKKIVEVLTVQKPMYETITFRFNTVEEYFPEGTTGKQMQEIIMGLLRDYQERWHKEREQKQAREQER